MNMNVTVVVYINTTYNINRLFILKDLLIFNRIIYNTIH
jgi:hypothetical protein